MSIISSTFLFFLFCTVILYYLVGAKWKYLVLLAASLCFYAFSGWDSLLCVILTAVIVYIASMLMKKNIDAQNERCIGQSRKEIRAIKARMEKKRKPVLIAALVCIIGILAYVKYSVFFLETLSDLFSVSLLDKFSFDNLIVPLGISFYTFMMISYLMDVYRAKCPAQENFVKYLSYVLYFPHITQGPLARYGDLAEQIYTPHRFDLDRIKRASWLMLWGFFKKLVIADRIGIFVGDVFGSYQTLTGPIFLVAGALYSVQIYCDFSGCMDIVRGASECFGITLEKNFLRPYFSKTLPEFWRRWHVTLGSFFRDYVFYPVSASKLFLRVNKRARELFGTKAGRALASCLPILSVWLLTGLWHGASWTFVCWGLFHGVLICLSTAFEEPLAGVVQRLKINTQSALWKGYQMLRTFFLCMIGRIFFISSSMTQALTILKKSFLPGEVDLLAFEYGKRDWAVVLFGILVLLAVSVIQEKNIDKGTNLRAQIERFPLWLRWGVLFFGIFFILVFGQYGSGVTTFIYEQF